MVPPPGTYICMEIVAIAVETNLFQWLFRGTILRGHIEADFEGCVTGNVEVAWGRSELTGFIMK